MTLEQAENYQAEFERAGRIDAAEDETRWHVGSNMPGYLPMTEPYHVTGWKYAAEALAEEIERSVPEPVSWESVIEEEAQIQDAYTEALEELKALISAGGPAEELGWVLPLSSSQYDLGCSHWIVQCLEPECELEEDEL